MRKVISSVGAAMLMVGLATSAFAQKKGKADPLGFMVSREIYKHLERIADAFEDVANEIDSLVIDHG